MFKHIATLLWNTRRSGTLLTLQIFLAFLVLFGVFSFTGSYFEKYATPLGFNVSDTYLVRVDLPDGVDTAAVPEIHRRARKEVLSLEGVREVSMAGPIEVFSNSNWGYGSDLDGTYMWTRVFMADEHFGGVMGVNMTEGRWFTPDDTIGGNWAVVVNEAFMTRNFPHSRPIDSLMNWFNDVAEGRQTKIVGVVENFKYRGEFFTEEALTFVPLNPWTDDFSLTNLMVTVDPGAGVEIQEAIYDRVSEVTKSRESAVYSMEKRRESTSRDSWVPIIALLSICAFLIANVALGLFGILINAIAKRKGEIGLRKAMGATSMNITSQLTTEVIFITIIGLLLGSIIAVQIPLFELIELDTKFFWWGGLGAAGLILVIVFLCALIPSGQASQIHPSVALRED
ncbi:MAG: ABC transporter permease [Saprospiraceae bacterium]